MTELDIYKQIVQKQDEILKIVLPEIMVDEFRECVVPLTELYNLNQQLEKAQETKLSIPLDVPSKKEIIQSVEYIFENTKRIHGNSEALDWQKIAIHKSVNYILSELASLPLDIPTDEEIENKFNTSPRNSIHPDRFRKEGAKWAIKQIIERNQK